VVLSAPQGVGWFKDRPPLLLQLSTGRSDCDKLHIRLPWFISQKRCKQASRFQAKSCCHLPEACPCVRLD
jgi:hypothetical protein